MANKFSKFVAAPLKEFSATLADFIREGAELGFRLAKPKWADRALHQSRSGNTQLVFYNGETAERLYLRVSSNVVAAITGGEAIDITALPVREQVLSRLEKVGDEYPSMLVLGMVGDEGLEEIKDVTTAFADFKVSEPVPQD